MAPTPSSATIFSISSSAKKHDFSRFWLLCLCVHNPGSVASGSASAPWPGEPASSANDNLSGCGLAGGCGLTGGCGLAGGCGLVGDCDAGAGKADALGSCRLARLTPSSASKWSAVARAPLLLKLARSAFSWARAFANCSALSRVLSVAATLVVVAAAAAAAAFAHTWPSSSCFAFCWRSLLCTFSDSFSVSCCCRAVCCPDTSCSEESLSDDSRDVCEPPRDVWRSGASLSGCLDVLAPSV